MKEIKFTLYGALIGLLSVVFGSLIFSVIPAFITLIAFRDVYWFLAGFLMAGSYALLFGILPGALGGAYLAHWLIKSDRTSSEVTDQSLRVGAFAGLVASLAFFGTLARFEFSWLMIVFAMIVVAIAAESSLLVAKFLARKKGKFVTTNSLP